MNECPTCHRPFGSTQRTCFACGRPILRNHKWHAEGCYMLHDDCQNPTIRVLLRAPEPEQPSLEPASPSDGQKYIEGKPVSEGVPQ